MKTTWPIATALFIAQFWCHLNANGDTFEIVPGRSVGQVTLGMTQDDVLSKLGEPTEKDGTLWIYKSEKTKNVLGVDMKDGSAKAAFFTSTSFHTSAGLNVSNIFSSSDLDGYVAWRDSGSGDEARAWIQGGLIFRRFVEKNLVMGFVLPEGANVTDLFTNENWGVVKAQTGGRMENPRPQNSSDPLPDAEKERNDEGTNSGKTSIVSQDSAALNLNPSREAPPESGMLVFKKLYIGMDIVQASRVISEAMKFSAQIFDEDGDGYVPPTRHFKISANVNNKALKIIDVRINRKENTILHDLEFFKALADRFEVYFKNGNDGDASIKRLAAELNDNLQTLVARGENGELNLDLAGLLSISADSEQSVTSINLEPELVAAWFNASDMSGEDFARTFLDSYHVPDLTPDIKVYDGFLGVQSTTNWSHTSPFGYKLTISDTKSIHVERIAKASQRKFD